MILDGSEGQTCRGLTGKLPQLHCLAPNVAPETQQALEQLDRCFSWCGRIEDMAFLFLSGRFCAVSEDCFDIFYFYHILPHHLEIQTISTHSCFSFVLLGAGVTPHLTCHSALVQLLDETT